MSMPVSISSRFLGRYAPGRDGRIPADSLARCNVAIFGIPSKLGIALFDHFVELLRDVVRAFRASSISVS